MRGYFAIGVVALILAGQAWGQSFPGTKSTWNGFDRYDFTFDGQSTYVVVPKTAAAGNPWMMRAGFAGYHEEVAVGLLNRGYFLTEMNIVNMMGSPTAVGYWNDLYHTMTTQYGLSSRVVVEGTSRGGLLAHNWAAQNAAKVSCVLGYVPVCDIKSWPAGRSVVPGMTGLGNSVEWQNLLNAYGMTQAQALAYNKNPIDTLQPLADAGVRILHLAGSADPHVPLSENSQIVYDRYTALGGNMDLIVVPGGDHAAWLTDVTPIVDFVTTPEPISLALFGSVAAYLLGKRF